MTEHIKPTVSAWIHAEFQRLCDIPKTPGYCDGPLYTREQAFGMAVNGFIEKALEAGSHYCVRAERAESQLERIVTQSEAEFESWYLKDLGLMGYPINGCFAHSDLEDMKYAHPSTESAWRTWEASRKVIIQEAKGS